MFYSKNLSNLSFNSSPPHIMFIDLNSCFATIEQQANPKLRGKPIAVAAYTTPSGCILAPSIEAKTYGIKTGMRVKEAKILYPNLIVLSPDPPKYRYVHLKLKKLLSDYTYNFYPKSIDEFVLYLDGYPVLKKKTMQEIGKEIKLRIKKEIGDWLLVSIGIAPNRFLAKTASSFKKPDGLVEINKDNFFQIYKKLDLRDLTGIDVKNASRLMSVGINSVTEFYEAPLLKIRSAFHSVLADYWYFRLRGWEVDSVEYGRKSFGNSYALPQPLTPSKELTPILSKLINKMGTRLRQSGYKAQGIHLAISYRDGDFWHRGQKTSKILFDSRDFYQHALKLMFTAPKKPVRDISVSCFNLTKSEEIQLEIFDDVLKKKKLVKSMDDINEKLGNFTVTSGRMLGIGNRVPDRISFGNVKELEEVIVW